MKQSSIVFASFLAVWTVTVVLFAELQAKGAMDENLRLSAFGKFTRVVNTIEKYYVDQITIDEIINKALDGLLANLDAHSGYLEAKQYQEMNIKTQGEFGGLGITVGVRDGALTIIAPMEGTPADKAGLESGDIILRINEKSTLGMSIDDAVSLMRGKPGSSINITIVRKNREKPFEVTMERAIIKVQSVYAKTYNNEVLYLRVVSFYKNVADMLKKEIAAHKSKTKGIILDLRNNPGGLLDQAIDTVDIFVDKGDIVSQKGRVESENKVYKATKAGSVTDIPLVVLVNGGSASASEIVSGSLQDHHRAVIAGERTFGKGSVQIILPLEGGEQDAIRLTIARYYLPSGRTIQATGVEPDVEIKRASIKELEDEFEIKESQLKDHLEAKLNEVGNTPQKEAVKTDSNTFTDDQLVNDNQLKSALGILRGLIVLKK